MEIELNKSWRVEPYYAFDKDKVPTVESVNRLGLVLGVVPFAVEPLQVTAPHW